MWAIYQNWDYDGDKYYGFYSTKELAEKELERLTYSSGYEIIKVGVDEPAEFHPNDTKEYWENFKKSTEGQGPYYDGDPGIRKGYKTELVLDAGICYINANTEELKNVPFDLSTKLITGSGSGTESGDIRKVVNSCGCDCGGCQEGEE